MPEYMTERVRPFGTSIFTEMSTLAAQSGAINLAQGFPDFAGPAFIKDAASAAIQADHNQYAPSHGLQVLREAVASAWKYYNSHTPNPDTEVTVTAGATEALLAACLAFVAPGDEVIIFEPFYDAYPPDVVFAGGVPRYVRLHEPHWTLDVAALREAITPRTRAIILNTPHNPTGKVWTLNELQALADLAIEHDLLVFSDEVYERLVFEKARHVAIATLPGMWERTVTISSTGKTFSLTGWKVGYAVAAAPLSEALRRVHQFITFCAPAPLQEAMATGLSAITSYDRQLTSFYAARRAELITGLRSVGVTVLPPAGTYFVLADSASLGWDDDVAFCRYLTTEVGVAAIPLSAFYHDHYQPGMIRFCFAKRTQTISAALERLAAASLLKE